jgi:CheY-like chemotaxis protein
MQRVLVVEDNGPRAFIIARILDRAGYETIGPCLTLRQASTGLELCKVDAAVFDIGSDEGFSAILADHLSKAGIPFAFVGGHSPRRLPERHRIRPYLAEPWSDRNLVAILHGILTGRKSRPSLVVDEAHSMVWAADPHPA